MSPDGETDGDGGGGTVVNGNGMAGVRHGSAGGFSSIGDETARLDSIRLSRILTSQNDSSSSREIHMETLEVDAKASTIKAILYSGHSARRRLCQLVPSASVNASVCPRVGRPEPRSSSSSKGTPAKSKLRRKEDALILSRPVRRCVNAPTNRNSILR